MDLQEFAKRYTEKLIAIAAQSKDAPEYEAYRRYQTDPTFHAQVDTLVLLAVDVIRGMDSDIPSRMQDLSATNRVNQPPDKRYNRR